MNLAVVRKLKEDTQEKRLTCRASRWSACGARWRRGGAGAATDAPPASGPRRRTACATPTCPTCPPSTPAAPAHDPHVNLTPAHITIYLPSILKTTNRYRRERRHLETRGPSQLSQSHNNANENNKLMAVLHYKLEDAMVSHTRAGSTRRMPLCKVLLKLINCDSVAVSTRRRPPARVLELSCA